jgi:hypothetical protein
MHQKKSIARSYVAALQSILIKEAISETRALADEAAAQNQKASEFKKAAEEKEDVSADKQAAAAAGINLKENVASIDREKLDEVGGLTGTAVEKPGLMGALRYISGVSDDPPIDIEKATKGIFNVLDTKAHGPADTKEIIRRYRTTYENSQKYISKNLRKLKQELVATQSKPFDRNLLHVPLVDDEDVAEERLQKAHQEVFKARRLLGYDAQDFIDALKVSEGDKYFTDEGAAITNPRAFFMNELTGASEGQYQPARYKASTIINNATDEQLKEIADGYGLDLKLLKDSQSKYQRYLNGETPKVEAPPEVKPTEDTKPKAPDQLELKLTPAPVPPPPDVPGITELDFSKRITLQTEGSKIKKPITDLKDTFETIGAKYKIHPAFLMAIATIETGHGSSKAFKTNKNAMGVTINDEVQAFDKVEDSIEMMAKKLSSKKGPYKGRFTVDEIAGKYAPSDASKKNDPNQTNKLWPGIVKKLMKQLGVTDADTIKVLSR